MARKGTGGIIGVPNTPTTSVASGIWTMFEQARWKNAGAWPGLFPVSIEYLVVAGGGGGGNGVSGSSEGAGGGAGGMLEGTLSLAASTAYAVRVGAGGAQLTNGSNSVVASVTATGGGCGVTGGSNAGSGGSGGGSYAGSRGTGIVGQGNDGGQGGGYGGTPGGGGGKGAAGTQSGGGIGGQSSITGTATYYAGGGGGAYTSGGLGGGGAGGQPGVAGTANTGGGGGGGRSPGSSAGGAGGSGVVILKIPSWVNVTFSAGVTRTVDTTSIPGFKIYRVTATSTISETFTLTS